MSKDNDTNKLAGPGVGPDTTQKLALPDVESYFGPDAIEEIEEIEVPGGFPDGFPEDAIDEGDLANIMDEIEQEAAEDAAIAAYESERKVDEDGEEPVE